MMSRRHGSVLNVHIPMIRWDTGIYAGVSHDDSTVHQKNKVLPEKDEVDAVFLCEKEEFR